MVFFIGDVYVNLFADVAKTLGADLGQNLLDKTGDFIGQVTPLFVACFSFTYRLSFGDYYNSSLDVLAVDFLKKMLRMDVDYRALVGSGDLHEIGPYHLRNAGRDCWNLCRRLQSGCVGNGCQLEIVNGFA